MSDFPPTSQPPLISAIVPTRNEARHLAATLAAACRAIPNSEVVVVDAGSTDRTAATAREFGARVVSSPFANRSWQMNLGARSARGKVLLFLHADTRLPRDAQKKIERAMTDPRVIGGAFTRRFSSPSLFLRFTCALARLRGQMFHIYLGDQAIWITADVFRKLHGYRRLVAFEDLDLSLRMRRAGRSVLLAGPVVSSARRFQRLGPMTRTLVDVLMTVRFSIHPEAYRRPRLKRTDNAATGTAHKESIS